MLVQQNAALPLSVAEDIATFNTALIFGKPLAISCSRVVTTSSSAISPFTTELLVSAAEARPPAHRLPLLLKLSFACELGFLEAGWLECAPLLQELDLRNNRLRTVPCEVSPTK